MTFGYRAVNWDFIVAQIGEDEGILGNEFAMAYQLTVRPSEGAVYLPQAPTLSAEEFGEQLTCIVYTIAEVQPIMEDALAVQTMEPVTMAPMALCQVSLSMQVGNVGIRTGTAGTVRSPRGNQHLPRNKDQVDVRCGQVIALVEQVSKMKSLA